MEIIMKIYRDPDYDVDGEEFDENELKDDYPC
jgi:hypothetical protein